MGVMGEVVKSTNSVNSNHVSLWSFLQDIFTNQQKFDDYILIYI